MMSIQLLPQLSTCISLGLKYDNMCDPCKSKEKARMEHYFSRSSKGCKHLWNITPADGCHSTSIIKHNLLLDNLNSLWYRGGLMSEKEIESKLFTKQPAYRNCNNFVISASLSSLSSHHSHLAPSEKIRKGASCDSSSSSIEEGCCPLFLPPFEMDSQCPFHTLQHPLQTPSPPANQQFTSIRTETAEDIQFVSKRHVVVGKGWHERYKSESKKYHKIRKKLNNKRYKGTKKACISNSTSVPE